jgi:hypothetical protein
MLELKDIKKGGLYQKGKTVYFISGRDNFFYLQTINGKETDPGDSTKEVVFEFLGKNAIYLGQLKDKIQL